MIKNFFLYYNLYLTLRAIKVEVILFHIAITKEFQYLNFEHIQIKKLTIIHA